MARARATNRADASTPIPLQPVLDAKPTSTQPSPDPRSTTRSDLSTPTLSIRRSTTIPGAGRHGARQTVERSTTSTPSSPVTRQRGTTRPARSSAAETSLTASTSPPTMIDSAARYRDPPKGLTNGHHDRPDQPRYPDTGDPPTHCRHSSSTNGSGTTGSGDTSPGRSDQRAETDPSPFGPRRPVNAKCPARCAPDRYPWDRR